MTDSSVELPVRPPEADETPRAGSSARESERAGPRPGDSFAGWKVISLIGRGGMGSVYRVQRGPMFAAMKVLQPHYLANERYRKRFMFECQQLQTLNHPNIVRLHEFGTADGLPYLIMELIDGIDLHTLVEKRGPLPWQQATQLLLTVARALEFARRRGLIHRDVKPENVLLQRKGSRARARLVDFGLIKQIVPGIGDESLVTLQPSDWFDMMSRFQSHMARVMQRDWSTRRSDREIRQVLRELRQMLYNAKKIELPPERPSQNLFTRAVSTGAGEADGRDGRDPRKGKPGPPRTQALGLTQHGDCLGTPYFMAPEMWLEVPGDHRADIFSLGVTWFFLMTGRYPFNGETIGDVMRATIQDQPLRINDARSSVEVPGAVQDVMYRMLARLPEQRYHRYRNLMDDLSRLLQDRRPLVDFMGVAWESARDSHRRKDAAEVLYDILQSFLQHAEIESAAAGAGVEDDTGAMRDPAVPKFPRPNDAAPLNPLSPGRVRRSFPGEQILGEAGLGQDAPVFDYWLLVTHRALRVYRANDRLWFQSRDSRGDEDDSPMPMPLLLAQADMISWDIDGPLLMLGTRAFIVLDNEARHVNTLLGNFAGSAPAARRRNITRTVKRDEIGAAEGLAVDATDVVELGESHDVALFDADEATLARLLDRRADELEEVEQWSLSEAGPQPAPPPMSPAAMSGSDTVHDIQELAARARAQTDASSSSASGDSVPPPRKPARKSVRPDDDDTGRSRVYRKSGARTSQYPRDDDGERTPRPRKPVRSSQRPEDEPAPTKRRRTSKPPSPSGRRPRRPDSEPPTLPPDIPPLPDDHQPGQGRGGDSGSR